MIPVQLVIFEDAHQCGQVVGVCLDVVSVFLAYFSRVLERSFATASHGVDKGNQPVDARLDVTI